MPMPSPVLSVYICSRCTSTDVSEALKAEVGKFAGPATEIEFEEKRCNGICTGDSVVVYVGCRDICYGQIPQRDQAFYRTWLNELPDPLSRIITDNLPPAMDK